MPEPVPAEAAPEVVPEPPPPPVQETDAEAKARRQAEALRPKLRQRLKMGKVVERTNLRAALTYYQEVVDLAEGSDPEPPEATEARARLKALAKEDPEG